MQKYVDVYELVYINVMTRRIYYVLIASVSVRDTNIC